MKMHLCMTSMTDRDLVIQWHFEGPIALMGFPKVVAALVAYSRTHLLQSISIGMP